MTDVKMPEPMAFRYKFKEDLQWQHTNTSFTIHRNALSESLYTAEQMKQFRKEGELAALEKAAKVCEELHWTWHMGGNSGPRECAAAIRALKDSIK